MKGIHIMDEGGRGMQGDDGGQSNPATTALMVLLIRSFLCSYCFLLLALHLYICIDACDVKF